MQMGGWSIWVNKTLKKQRCSQIQNNSSNWGNFFKRKNKQMCLIYTMFLD